MPCPLGETGVGKIGLRPPTSHELRAIARAAEPRIVSSARALRTTRWKYRSALTMVTEGCGARPDRIQTDCGRRTKTALCRRVQPQPVGGMPALRPADGSLHR